METALKPLYEQLVEDPIWAPLRNLPCKVETNERGQIVLSPHKKKHAKTQERVQELMRRASAQDRLPPGRAYPEMPVQAPDPGKVNVADVAWLSDERDRRMPEDEAACSIAPEVCVEILSRSNTQEAMAQKRADYFAAGAVEVWIVDGETGIFYQADPDRPAGRQTPRSGFMPAFPARL